MDPSAGQRIRLASFNVHCGVDGWGRPFDVVGACAALDADLLVLQESWRPDGDAPSTAATVAEALGYRWQEEELAHGRLYGPNPDADEGWGPPPGPTHDTLQLDGYRRRTATAVRQQRPFGTGTFNLALLSRVPLVDTGTVILGRLPRDPARRLVLTASVSMDGGPLQVFGTHMSHLLYRSPVHYLALRAAVPGPDTAAVVAGDMNLWGPGVVGFLGQGWRRAVRGRTWPSSRPHSQLDHIVVTRPVTVAEARVAADSGSDHRPVVATLGLR